MKPTKSFTVETKRKGRRTVKTVHVPIWEPHMLQSLTNAIRESSEAEAEDTEAVEAKSGQKRS